eukprot:8029725-Alexandrium_andersonii.AAC.1
MPSHAAQGEAGTQTWTQAPAKQKLSARQLGTPVAGSAQGSRGQMMRAPRGGEGRYEAGESPGRLG